MATNCCHQEYAEECEILVCVDAPAPHNPGLYQRLRFGLRASSWLPSPLGIFLWSALHVMLLIVCGPVYGVLGLLTAFLFLFLVGLVVIVFFSSSVVCGVIAVAVDLVRLLVRSIKFCWSLVGFLTCHEPIVEWRGGECWTVLVWKSYESLTREFVGCVLPIGVPCMRGSLCKESKDRKLKTWARWSEEVVHMHEAIAL